ncbi:hypothetical protein DJ71_27245 [Halorubrum sp. E3]|nr:hypothetical protein DJ71_27245 [Halorubrum sp. E3]
MGVQPTDFEEHSDRIKDDYDDEISRRCAISRGYYYAFHLTREKGDSHPKGNFNYGAGDHAKAKQFLRKAVGNDLADDLDDLHDKRKTADYDLNDDVDEMFLSIFEHELEEFILDLKSEV